MNLNSIIQDLLNKLNKSPENKAKEKLIDDLKKIQNDFIHLEKKIITTPEQMMVMSRLLNVISKMGNIK